MIWESLNAEINPAESEKLRDGTLFLISCPKCENNFQLIYPILYHDMTSKVMVQLILNEKEADDFVNALKSDTWENLAAEGYKYRLVRTLNGLREKAMVFSCGLDDRVVECMKLVYFTFLTEKYPEMKDPEMLFYHIESSVLVFFSEGKPVFDVEFDMGKYTEIASDARIDFEGKSQDCLFIDREWALGLL